MTSEKEGLKMPRYIITTNTDGFKIDSAIEMRGMNDIRQHMTRMIIDTQDQQIRAALIKLGWTPPDPHKERTDHG